MATLGEVDSNLFLGSYNGTFKVDTAFNMLCTEHPEFQAATQMSVEDALAQWTRH